MLDDNRPTYGAHPDAVLLRQLRMRRAEAVAKLAVALTMPFDARKRKGGNPRPTSRAKPVTCPACKTVYPQRKGHFSNSTKTCRTCCDAKLRVCPSCQAVYPNGDAFRYGGKSNRICQECAVAEVYRKVERRLARKSA